MNDYHRRLVVVCICFIFVGAMIAFKVNEQRPLIRVSEVKDIVINQPQSSLVADTYFYDQQDLENTVYGTKDDLPSQSKIAPTPVSSSDMVSAKAYLVGNVETGEIILKHNISMVLPVASMSKLITAIAATDTISPTTTITISDEMTKVAGDASMLVAEEKFKMTELLYPLLLSSSNIAAEALASAIDRTKFLELMSSYAWEVGMPKTFFADPSGIDPNNQSSAEDFFALARYLYKSRSEILAITRMDKTFLGTTTDHNYHDFVNTHPFVNDQNFIGGKTGRTPQALETMLTIIKINDKPIAVIVLGSEIGSRASDTRILIDRVK
jgi:D-alanyl-D-alanine carboxypeptidase